ncbi:nucleotidyltransferase family protein (plasmid) [Streptomyces sp. NBC_00445]|uniref:nucleotidyltransferase family protein n=1 Tax=Streptomyces sp. NBC_00445 TaxID=2975745 RepID=UPI002E246869
MSAPGTRRAAGAQPALPETAGPVQAVLRWLCDPRPTACAPPAQDFSPLGAVLEGAIDAKLVCMLADRLLHGRLDVDLSRPMHSFLARTLRANAQHAHLHRGEAVRIVQALTRLGVPVAVLNGLAYDTGLYPPGGLRQFTDIDLLVDPADREAALGLLAELGFAERGRGAHTRRRPTGDALTPAISVDVATILGHTADPADVRAALARAHTVEPPHAGEQLPVLARADALRHALARLATRPRWTSVADAARLALTSPNQPPAAPEKPLPTQAHTGWAVLRTYLPDLPPHPPVTAAPRSPGRAERAR